MTPFSLLCFLTVSTRIAVDCLHIFGMVVGGKWMYPPAGLTTTNSRATPVKQASTRVRMEAPLAARLAVSRRTRGRHVPQPHGAVGAAGSQTPAVGTEGDGQHRVRVPG